MTGTLWSGEIAEGSELVAEPSGLQVRVRSVQVHDLEVERASPGQRVAVSLPGVERNRLRRGEALVERLYPPPTDSTCCSRRSSRSQITRAHVHHGTGEHYARLVRIGER